jgi:hypothetical protein
MAVWLSSYVTIPLRYGGLGFRYGLALVIGTLRIMASTGVFVHVFVLSNALLRISPHRLA